MKRTSIFCALIIGLCSHLSYGCSCENIPSFCEYAKEVAANEKGLIWTGELIYVDTIDQHFAAYQFKVINVIHGEVIEAGSPMASDSEYENTDSTVWVLGGESSLCNYRFEDGVALFATPYNSDGFGYGASLCATAYLSVSADNMVSGYLNAGGQVETLSLDETLELLDSPCLSSDGGIDNPLEKAIEVFPTVFRNNFFISSNFLDVSDINIEIIDMMGNRLVVRRLKQSIERLTLENVPPGRYIVSFCWEAYRYNVNVVKY